MNELILGLVAIVVALVGGGVGWWQIGEHGEERQKRRQAERERDAYRDANDLLLEPGPTLDELERVSAREASRKP